MTVQELRETKFIIKNEPKTYKIDVPIQHWQLRDMLKVYNNSLVFSQGNKVYSFDTETYEIDIVLDALRFHPTSIACNHDFLVVGGPRGEYFLKNMVTNKIIHGSVDGSINNAIQIQKQGGETRMFVCNNDNTLKIYTINDMKKVDSITHTCPVNNCEMSPDGKYLVITGDSNEVVVYSVEANSYRKINNLKSVNDGGFRISWNSFSTMFAVSTQDGYVCLWDIRNIDKPLFIPTKQHPNVRGACRNVHFSKINSLDLLLFTEHTSYFTLIDTRDFEKRQSINVSDEEGERQISGSIFSNCGEKVYIGTDEKIFEYEIDTPGRRMFSDYSMV